jgi:Aerotolerance regulator N-terminal
MQFLSANVLWGLLAMAIPLIVHLFNFRRTKKVYFSNVALLKTVETNASAFRKLMHLLIMLCRMLFIAALVMAFAQPLWSKAKKGLNAKPLGINGLYLDNSLSMQNITDNKRYLDLAILRIDELLSLFNRATNLQMVTNDFEGNDQFITSTAKIKDRLTTVDFSEQARSINQVYKRMHSVAEKNRPSAENHFFMFSDYQKSTAGTLEDIKVNPNDKLYIVPIAGSSSPNVFIDSTWLSVPMIREMQYNTLHVKVFNSGEKKVEKLPLKLSIDGVQASTSTVTIGPNQSAEATFKFTVKGKGEHRGKIEFNDQPIVFDNSFHFVLNASPSIKVLHLYNQKSPENYIGKIYSNDSLFSYTSYAASVFDPAMVSNANLVVLEGLNTIEGDLRANLIKFVNAGGSLCVIPSESPNAASYNGFLNPMGISGLSTNNVAAAPQNFIEVAEPDKGTPFYDDVFEKGTFNAVTSLPKALPKLTWQGVAERLLIFKNGKPFLTKTRVRAGQIYLLASGLQSKLGDFGEHAFYVPTFYKMASLSAKMDRIAYNFNEENISFFMPNAPKNANYKLRNGKLELIPIQKLIDNTLSLTLPKAADLGEQMNFNSGYYELLIDNKKVRTLAFNHVAAESKMERYTPTELKKIFANQPNVKVYDSIFDDGFKTAFADTSQGKPLWKYFVILALVFLFIEILLARYLKTT